eukprot:m51a1_g7693 putative glycine n-acyltransferase-like protein 3 (260) ;mRNA; f:56759-57764
MEIKPELTAPVLRLLDKTFPESLPVLYALRNGSVASLITDDPDNPTFLVATGQDSNNAPVAVCESFIAATDVDAAARVLRKGNLLGAMPDRYVDAVLRAWPGSVDPRPDGYLMFLKSLRTCELPSVVLSDGARVRRLTEADAELVNKYWVRGAGDKTLGYVRTLLSRFGGFGVETSAGELVAWVVRYENESVGMGYTLEQHRGKGYTRAVSREVYREQQKEGLETAYFFTHSHNKSMLAYAAGEGFVAAEGLRYLVSLN